MLTRLLHRIVAHPKVYERVQALVGANAIQLRLEEQARVVPQCSLVLDLGGGTGVGRNLWPPDTRYICLDMDSVKLSGFSGRDAKSVALLSDATRTGLRSGSVDVVVCKNMSHHIPDALLEHLIKESARILKPDGRLIFVDAVWEPKRKVSRLLWKYDRGSFPRPEETLRTVLSRECAILHWERFAVLHEYVVCVATPLPKSLLAETQHLTGSVAN